MATHGILVIGSVLFLISIITRIQCYSPGYSFSKFMGPVSGIEQKIGYYDDGKYKHDYVAKPDYHFEYGVRDPKSKVHQSRQETRLGDTVKGEYSVLDPDGKLRTVKYTADKKNGFQASVITDGHVVHHPQEPVQPIHHDPLNPYGGSAAGEDDEYLEGDEGDEEGDDEGEDEGEEYSESGGDEDEYY